MSLPVTYQDVLDALPRVRGMLQPTPLIAWPGLSELLGFPFFLKHENHQPVGAFKVRGGVNLLAAMSDKERAAGILGVSTGNHGQSLAFAAKHFGADCAIVVPRGSNPDKVQAMRRLDAEVIEHGRDFDEARDYIGEIVSQRGGRYVHSANEPMLIAGVGTYAQEIFDELSHPDVILVPVGLGSGVCGTCIVAKHLNPRTQVIGVQAVGAPAVAESWRSGQWKTHDRVTTIAEGVATRTPAEMTLDIMSQLLDDMILVSDEEMRRAVYQILRHSHNLAETAGAATFAAAAKHRGRFRGKNVVGVLSGGNLDLAELPGILKDFGETP